MNGRGLSSIGAMGFYHQDGFVSAWNLAKKFAGEDGKIATLPDIVEARLSTGPNSVAWSKYYITMTAEYFGLSKGGNKILIVAHGIGPMSTLDGVLKAYSYEFKDKDRNRRGGRIPRSEFLKLESGHYGPVKIVEFKPILHHYQYSFIGILRLSRGVEEPLLNARLGPKWWEYQDRQAVFAREWHAKQAEIIPENQCGLSIFEWETYLRRRKLQHTIRSCFRSDPYIIKLGDAANCSYRYFPLEDNMAMVHLISIGQLQATHHEGNESLICEIDCHEWWNSVRLVAMRKGVEFTDIHPGFGDINELICQNWRSLMKPVTQNVYPGLRPLVRVGMDCFTQYPKQGDSMDTYEPEFLVTEQEEIGNVTTFETVISGYEMFSRYDIKEVQAIAPVGANAYMFIGEPRIIYNHGRAEKHYIGIRFYSVKVDTTKRLARADEIRNDFDLLMRLVVKS